MLGRTVPVHRCIAAVTANTRAKTVANLSRSVKSDLRERPGEVTGWRPQYWLRRDNGPPARRLSATTAVDLVAGRAE